MSTTKPLTSTPRAPSAAQSKPAPPSFCHLTNNTPAKGILKSTADFLLYKMAGFILALQIRYLYNYYYTPRLGSVKYGQEPWPSTYWAFMAIIPLAGVLQLVINWMFGQKAE